MAAPAEPAPFSTAAPNSNHNFEASPASVPDPFLAESQPVRAPFAKGPAMVMAIVVLCIVGTAAGLWAKNRGNPSPFGLMAPSDASDSEDAGEEGEESDEAAAIEALFAAANRATSNTAAASSAPTASVPGGKTPAQPLAQPIVASKATPPPNAAPAVTVHATPVKFPPLRLQSIFYRRSNPSVMINGKTLFIGDEINGVRVADIQAANVTLVLSGQTNVLTLR
jgi:hypothetical protein